MLFSFSYSGGGGIETRGGKRGPAGPGWPKKQKENVDKGTGNDKDLGGESGISPCQYDCGKTFDIKKQTGQDNKANHEKGCGKRAAERAADDDSGDAHLSGEGHTKKQSLPSKCCLFCLW